MSLATSFTGEITGAVSPFSRAGRLGRQHAAPVAKTDISTEDAAHFFVQSLESAMLGIVLTGAALFATGLCRFLLSGPVAGDGALVFGALALATAAGTSWAMLTNLVRFVRLIRR